MARKNKTNELWHPGKVSGWPSISVIEPSDEPGRSGAPFGFGRVLYEEERRALEIGKRFLAEYNGPKVSDGWDEHMDALV